MDITRKNTIIGIVLYNPNLERLADNIKNCLQQTEKILLIDNGSRNINRIKDIYGANKKICIIYNKKNMGIAYALNQILYYAIENSFEYFLTLDQDSIMEKNYLEIMSSNLGNFSNWGIGCPRVIDTNLLEKDFNKEVSSGPEMIEDPWSVITSGCIVRTSIAEKIDGFNNKLFIDYVDVDFNERLILANYKIIKISNAILYHELGKSEYHKFLGFKVLVDNHNSLRRYYITRNRLYFSKKYFGKKGYYKERVKVLFSEFKILLFEDNKMTKLSSIKKGIKDVNKIYKG